MTTPDSTARSDSVLGGPDFMALPDGPGPREPNPQAVSALRASVPNAEIVAILAEYDQYIAPCPINNPKRGRVYAPHEKCERCGARADQNCGLDATASWHLIRALRRVVGAS